MFICEDIGYRRGDNRNAFINAKQMRAAGFFLCKLCEEWKERAEQGIAGRDLCKSCNYKRARAWAVAHPERRRAYARSYDKGGRLEEMLVEEAWRAEQVVKQQNICAFPGCERRADQEQHGQLHADHNKKTGKLRALLCMRHNVWVGVYELHKDGIEAYLKEYDD